MGVQFEDSKVLFDSNKVAMHDDCCCDPEIVDCCDPLTIDVTFNNVDDCYNGMWALNGNTYTLSQSCYNCVSYGKSFWEIGFTFEGELYAIHVGRDIYSPYHLFIDAYRRTTLPTQAHIYFKYWGSSYPIDECEDFIQTNIPNELSCPGGTEYYWPCGFAYGDRLRYGGGGTCDIEWT